MRILLLSGSFLFLIACESYSDDDDASICPNCILELSLDLPQDSLGYYHLDFNQELSQMYLSVYADVGHGYEYVGWTTDNELAIINGSTYSNDDGISHGLLLIYNTLIGDTLTVYCGYYDDWSGDQLLDSLKISIDE